MSTTDPATVVELAQHATPAQLSALIALHGWTLETIQTLKNYSASFHFSDSERALQIAKTTAQISQFLPAPASLWGQWTLANALMHDTQYNEAVALFTQTHHEFLRVGDALNAARMSVGYVYVLGYVGKAEEGLEVAGQSEAILQKAGAHSEADQRRLAGLLLNVGVIYDRLNQFEESLEVLERLRPLVIELKDRFLLAQVQHNHAYCLAQMSLFDKAIALYRQAEMIFLEEGATEDLVRLYINVGSLYALLGNYAQAKIAYEKADTQLAGTPHHSQARRRLAILRAQFHLLTGSTYTPELFEKLRDAQNSFAQVGPVLDECLAWLMLGRGYLLAGKTTEAQACFHSALARLQVDDDRGLELRVLHGLGQVERQQGNDRLAVQYLSRSIQMIESIRSTLAIETHRAAFLTDKLDVYRDLTQLHLQNDDLESAFWVTERAKSRLIAEKLAWRLGYGTQAFAESSNAATNELVQQLQVALQELETIYRKTRLTHQPSEESVDPFRLESTHATRQAEERVQRYLDTIQRIDPHFSLTTLDQMVKLEPLVTLLGDSVFVQFHIFQGDCYAFVIGSDGIRGHIKLASLAEVERQQTLLKVQIDSMLRLSVQLGADRAANTLSPLLANVNRVLATLYDLLFRPILPYLPSKAPLIFSPDDLLYYVPFQALFDGKHYLIEQRSISYSPSATLLSLCTDARAQGTTSLLCGFDDGRLATVGDELRQLAGYFQSSELVVDERVSTQLAMAKMPTARFIHLAAHATFRSDNPMLSSITLADRRLTLAEIVRLQLSAELVTLSACETARGQLRGAESISLASGFLGAGARSLLVSLWQVEDESAAGLMKHFYHSLLNGEDRASALRAAQCMLLDVGRQATAKQKLYQHPAFWAPFTLLGYPGSLTQ